MSRFRFTLLMFCCFLVFFTFAVGCSFDETKETAEEHSDIIISCIKENDVSTLEEMFCPYIRDNHKLYEEIKAAFEFIDGEIVSEGDKHYLDETGGAVENGQIVSSRIQPEIRNVKTDSNKEYTIIFNEYLINTENPDYTGITRITITNEIGLSYTIGEIISA